MDSMLPTDLTVLKHKHNKVSTYISEIVLKQNDLRLKIRIATAMNDNDIINLQHEYNLLEEKLTILQQDQIQCEKEIEHIIGLDEKIEVFHGELEQLIVSHSDGCTDNTAWYRIDFLKIEIEKTRDSIEKILMRYKKEWKIESELEFLVN
jgi:hypothetical protein